MGTLSGSGVIGSILRLGRSGCGFESRLPDLEDIMNTEQSSPTPSSHPAVWDLVLEDIKERDENGRLKYGIRLQPFNRRDPLIDLYQELLDAVVYLRQLLYERYGK